MLNNSSCFIQRFTSDDIAILIRWNEKYRYCLRTHPEKTLRFEPWKRYTNFTDKRKKYINKYKYRDHCFFNVYDANIASFFIKHNKT